MAEDKTKNSFKSLLTGVEPIKRKSKVFNLFQNQANHPLPPLPSSTQKAKKTENQTPHLAKKIDSSVSEKLLKREVSGEFQFEKIDAVSKLDFRDSSVSIKKMRSLKAGKIHIATEVDLHGLTREQSQRVIARLLNNFSACNVLVIHGKGHNSETKEALLKSWLSGYLKEQRKVRAFCSATHFDGGTGAVYVLLK